MKYEIEHVCGHTETVQLCGTNVHGERDKKAEWLASKPCKECLNAKEHSATDIWEAANPDIKPITRGSEKQIAWARDIRRKCLSDVDIKTTRKDGGEDFEAYLDWLNGLSASWWIDNQHMTAQMTVKYWAKHVYNQEES